MIDLQDKNYCPGIGEINEYVRNSVFMQFCTEIRDTYECKEKIEYSSCSWKKGWNIKFKKAGKTLCTVYPGEYFFTIMIVVGTKEKALVEAILPECFALNRNSQKLLKSGPGSNRQTANRENNYLL